MIDFSSATWTQVSALMKAQLARARERNDQVGLSEAETNAYRGEIRILKTLLALPEAADREKQFVQAAIEL